MSTIAPASGLRRKLASPAIGATVAQVFQAVASFGIQICAAWVLGASGLGTMAICLGVIIIGTAVTSGVVGDSLTVLDRHDRAIRGGLEFWAVVIVLTTSTATALGLVLTGTLGWSAGVAFWLASALFQLEELVRRIFTATMRFWNLIAIDGAALVVSMAGVGLSAATGRMSIGSFLYSIAVGQLAGIAVGLMMMPPQERAVVPMRGGARAEVLGFGGWRGIQVAVGPTALTLSRMTIAVALGTAAVGRLEAARIFAAPAMLVVQGLGSYLMSSYAKQKHLPIEVLRARATRASIMLTVGALGFGVVMALLAPIFGTLVTGGSFAVSSVAILGWACVAAATATLQPFSSLAVARGHQRGVLLVRLIDAGTGIALLLLAVRVLHMPAEVSPFATASGLVLAGFLVRTVLLRSTPTPVRTVTPGTSLPHPVPREQVSITPAASQPNA